MKLLLDECVRRFLKRDLAEHDVSSVEDVGFKGLENSALLKAAAREYDALITVDRKLAREQNVASFQIAVIVLISRSNRYPDLKPLVPALLQTLKSIEPARVFEIKSETR